MFNPVIAHYGAGLVGEGWPDCRAADVGSSGLADPAGDETGRKELNPKATAAALFVRLEQSP